jgi:toxin ParE1/3/4
MSRRLIVRDEAEADLTEAALWYDEREPGLGWELTLEVHAAIRRAVENPPHHLLLRYRPEVRRVLARRFPYRIFFLVRDDAIVVFAVLHAARHARHWRQRL